MAVAVCAAGPGIAALRRIRVQEIELELGIGDVVQIGELVCIVLDIENGEVCFRIAPVEELTMAPTAAPPGK